MLTKMVNGVSVVCSPDEEAAFLAEWAANAKMAVQKTPTLAQQIAADPAQVSVMKSALGIAV